VPWALREFVCREEPKGPVVPFSNLRLSSRCGTPGSLGGMQSLSPAPISGRMNDPHDFYDAAEPWSVDENVG